MCVEHTQLGIVLTLMVRILFCVISQRHPNEPLWRVTGPLYFLFKKWEFCKYITFVQTLYRDPHGLCTMLPQCYDCDVTHVLESTPPPQAGCAQWQGLYAACAGCWKIRAVPEVRHFVLYIEADLRKELVKSRCLENTWKIHTHDRQAWLHTVTVKFKRVVCGLEDCVTVRADRLPTVCGS
jgi:hypothetical protein